MKKLLPAFILIAFSQTVSAQFLALPNSGFENWTSTEPDNWYTNNSTLTYPVTKSTDKHSGAFAVKGEVTNYNTWTAPTFGTPGNALFVVNQTYTTINFFYKFNKLNNDAITITGGLLDSTGTPVAYLYKNIADGESSYTSISIPFVYIGASPPAKLSLTIGIQDTILSTATPGSYFLFDDFSLGGFVGIDELNSSDNIFVFNNPATDFISFSVPEKNPSLTVSLADVTGKQIITPFHSESAINKIETENLSGGIYFLTITNEKSVRVKKVIVAR